MYIHKVSHVQFKNIKFHIVKEDEGDAIGKSTLNPTYSIWLHL